MFKTIFNNFKVPVVNEVQLEFKYKYMRKLRLFLIPHDLV